MKYLTLPLTLIVMLLISNIIAWAGFIWSYQSFTQEEPILTLRFEESAEDSYLAQIEAPSSIRGEYKMYGDQWRIEARFVKMRYWANLLGVESRYAIDRLQGRYIDIQDENRLPNIAHQLNDEGVSHFTIFGWSPFVDTEYGSSTYQLIDVNKRFFVFKTPTGLMVRSETEVPEGAEEGENWLDRLWR